MVTDTVLYRCRLYRGRCDTPEKLDYARIARVVEGLAGTLVALAGGAVPIAQGSSTLEPVVLRDSRSRCACAASANW